MPRRMLLTAVLALLAAAPAASAKEVEKVQVCGAAGCSDVTKVAGQSLFFDSTTPGDPPAPSAFVRIHFRVGDGSGQHHDTFAIVATTDGRHLRTGGPDGAPAWFTLRADQGAAVRRAIRGIEPFPASRMPATAPYVPPTARVVETFSPAAATATSDDGGIATGTLVLGGGVLLLALAGLARLRPRRAPRPSGAA
jgi:hypothetical protein